MTKMKTTKSWLSLPQPSNSCATFGRSLSVLNTTTKIFALTATSGQPAHVVILTTSGHPNSALAALEAGAKVHVMFDRVSKHSEAHGEQLLTGQ